MAAQSSYYDHSPAAYTQQSFSSQSDYHNAVSVQQNPDYYKQPAVAISPIGIASRHDHPPTSTQAHSYASPLSPFPPSLETTPHHSTYTGHHALTQPIQNHLSTLPMFALSTHHEAKAKQEWVDKANKHMEAYIPKPKLNPLQKATMLYMDVVGGGSISSARHFHNGLVLANAKAAGLNAKEMATIMLTRWMLTRIGPNAQAQTILVDVLEYRFKAVHNQVYVKSSAMEEIKLTLLEKSGLKLKPGGTQKIRMTRKTVEEVAVIDMAGQVQQMVILNREQRGCAPAEWREMKDRFEHGWHVPRI